MGSILAIDYGLKRIGLAISDPDRIFAFPYRTILNQSFDSVLSEISFFVKEKDIDLIIVGMPYSFSPSCSPEKRNHKNSMEKIVMNFVKKLKKKLNVTIETVDERLSSFMAEENLKESGLSSKKLKKFVDEEAARLLLEEYIQKLKNP